MDTESAGAAARVEEELAALLPGRSPALHIEQVVERTRLLLARLGVAPEVWEDRLTVRTVRYYRTKGIISAPFGEGPNARYGRRHVLEAATARLAGHLHHLSLADAAERIAALDDAGLAALLAELVDTTREESAAAPPLSVLPARPLPGRAPASAPAGSGSAEDGSEPVAASHSVTLHLPHGALLVLPAGHPALARSPAADVGQAVAGLLDDGPPPA
jgi:DNA-binding transcriptional MerR regulator